ncbi:hypothetical protein ACFFRR_006894 [Megaselia abdita]
MCLSYFGGMIYMNIILALNVPDHWCVVPGRNNTNFTLEEWKNITLPSEKNNRDEDKYSSCQMYDINFEEVKDWDYTKWNYSDLSKSECKHGYDYDRTWYKETIPSDEDWVCEKDLYMTNTFVVSRILEVVGAFVLGQLGDSHGRQKVFYFAVIATSFGRILSILETSSFLWFAVGVGIAGFAVSAVFMSPFIISMEISSDDDRTKIAMLQSLGWSISTTVLPLICWWLNHWMPFMWVTTIPTLLILIFSKYAIESPRWLINKKRFADAIRQFKIIAKVNKRKFDITEEKLEQMFRDQTEETVYGMASLFSTWRMAKNTIIMGFSWCVAAVSFFVLVLFSAQMGGNPFINFLFQSIVEVPAYILGKYVADKFGRRLTNSCSFLMSGIFCIPIIIYAKDPEFRGLLTILSTVIKFFNAITFFVVNLQGMEVYPTCLRQTGLALGHILANGIGIVAPYMVYLGTTYDIRCPYYILGVLFFLGGTAAIFLPETLHQKLPDTLEEGKIFGKGQKFFSLPKATEHYQEVSGKEGKLNDYNNTA